MIVPRNVQINEANLLGAADTQKIAIALAYREFFDFTNSQSLRDEWARAFWRHLFDYTTPGDFHDLN